MCRILRCPRQQQAAIGAIVLAATLATGCSAITGRRGGLEPSQPSPGQASAGDLTSAQDRTALASLAASRTGQGRDGYRIGPDDLLDIRIPRLLGAQQVQAAHAAEANAALPSVAAAPVFQQGVRVSASGDISLPLLGTVSAAGRTPAELEREIARRLVAGGILVNPAVSVHIAEHRSNVVAVVGSVVRPGLYPLTRPGATIADFVWAAGGPTNDAGRVVNFSPSTGDGLRGAPIRLDLETLLKDRSGAPNAINPVATAGDLITIAPAGSVQVDGWVEKPGSYPVTRGLTLTGAVAAAGGHHFAADRRHASVKRGLGGGDQKLFTVDLDAVAAGREPDFPLTDGDVVHLPASTERLVPWVAYEATKQMIHVGASMPLF